MEASGLLGHHLADRRPWDLSVSLTKSQFLIMNLFVCTYPIGSVSLANPSTEASTH